MGKLVETVEALYKELQLESFNELNERSLCEEKSIEDFSIAVWKDLISESELRIVVQGYQPACIAVGMMYARGFRKTKEGQTLPLTKEEVEDFS